MDMLTVAGKQARLVQWQSLVLDLDGCTVRAGGVLLGASPAEFALLRLLIARRDIPLAREFIMESLFGSEHGRDRAPSRHPHRPAAPSVDTLPAWATQSAPSLDAAMPWLPIRASWTSPADSFARVAA